MRGKNSGIRKNRLSKDDHKTVRSVAPWICLLIVCKLTPVTGAVIFAIYFYKFIK